MKSKARRIVERWVTQNVKERKPFYVAEGSVFLYPSGSLAQADGYPVVWIRRRLPSDKLIDEFLCGCKGWWYSTTDDCRHVADLKNQIEHGKPRMML